jgi:hypothetical protein
MADRQWLPPAGGLEVDIVELYADVTIDTSAPGGRQAVSSKGIKSVTRNSVGNYTVLLNDRYNKLLWAGATIIDASPASVGVACQLASEAVNSATPSLVWQFYGSDDVTAADPANGALVKLCIKLRNSSVQ